MRGRYSRWRLARPGEAAVPVRAPLHRGAHPVSISEVDVVAHANLVAVIQHRRPGQREQQGVDQLDLAPRAQQRRQATPDAQVDAGVGVVREDPDHEVALLVGDHLEGQLVVVPQEGRPLTVGRDGRGLGQDVEDGEAVLELDRHEHARHQREVEVHVAFVAGTEVRRRVGGPLVGLGQQHAIVELGVDVAAQVAQEAVGLGQVLAAGAGALEQVGHRVEAQAVDAELEPEVDHAQHLLAHLGVVEVEVGLVGVEAVPVVGLGDRIPRPVGALEVGEDDARLGVLLRAVAPHVVVALRAARRGVAGALEPCVVRRGVVEHQLGDHAQAPLVGLVEQLRHVVDAPVRGVHAHVVGDVIAAVAQRRRVERQQPQRGDAEVAQVVELADEAGEIAHAVAVGVVKGAHVQLVDQRVHVPGRVARQAAGPACRALLAVLRISQVHDAHR